MSAAWLIVPAVIFLASRRREAAPATPSDPELIASVSIDVNAIAERLRERAFGVGNGERRLQVKTPAPTAAGPRGWRGVL